MNIKNLLKEAWQITWHNPVLWIFGFFTAFLFNNEVNIFIQNFQFLDRLFNRLYTLQATNQKIFNWTNFRMFFTNVSLINLLIFISIVFIFICLAVATQIILIKTGHKLIDKSLFSSILNQKHKLTLKECLKIDRRYFWLILILNIANLLLVYLIFLLIGYPLVLIFLKSGHQFYLNLFFILTLIIFLIFSIIISFLVRFAIFYILLFNQNFNQALNQSLNLFRKHWLKSLYFALVIFAISLFFGLVLLAVVATSAVPLIILINIFLQFKIIFGYWLILVFGLILFSLIIFVFGSIFSTFQTMAWLIFFLKKLHPQSKYFL